MCDKLPTENVIELEADTNSNETHTCEICFETLHPGSVGVDGFNECIKLPCNHVFCYDCLLQSYKGENCSYYSKPNYRMCPYCRAKTPYLPLKPNTKPLKGIHREYNAKYANGQNKYKINMKICKATYTTGIKKGQACTACAKAGSDYCGRHKSWANT